MRSAIAYAATALAFLSLDAVWLVTMTERFYRPRMAALLLDQPNLAVAAAFYLSYVAGMVVFVVRPALLDGRAALGRGALLGAFAYATYDLTNLATLRGFPAEVAAVDIVWGAFATGIACAIAAAVTRRLAPGAPQ